MYQRVSTLDRGYYGTIEHHITTTSSDKEVKGGVYIKIKIKSQI